MARALMRAVPTRKRCTIDPRTHSRDQGMDNRTASAASPADTGGLCGCVKPPIFTTPNPKPASARDDQTKKRTHGDFLIVNAPLPAFPRLALFARLLLVRHDAAVLVPQSPRAVRSTHFDTSSRSQRRASRHQDRVTRGLALSASWWGLRFDGDKGENNWSHWVESGQLPTHIGQHGATADRGDLAAGCVVLPTLGVSPKGRVRDSSSRVRDALASPTRFSFRR
jgi:hypothetical protein